MRRTSVAIVLCVLLGASAPAYAQRKDAATAEALFRQGRQAMESKNYNEACPRFAESQKLDPAAGTLMNLATCEEKLTKLASAWQHWKEAVDALPAGDDRIPFARSRVDDLEKRLPKLQVILAASTEKGAKVFRDEIELGSASQGVMLPVDPGQHAIVVRLQGHLPGWATVTVAEGESKQIEVHVGAVERVVEPPVQVAPKSTSRTLGWVLGGVGLAGVGTGVVTGLMIASKQRTVDSDCSADKTCASQRGLDAASSGKTLLIANTAAWIVGGLGLGLGAYFVISGSRSSRTTTALAPTVGADGAALSWLGTF
jgi:hypothetical protein